MTIRAPDPFLSPGQGNATPAPGALPHGLVRPPAVIVEYVAGEKARLQPYFNNEQEKRTLDDMTLAYHYEGLTVAYRSFEEGLEILAVGPAEVGAFLARTPPEQRLGVRIKQP